MTGASIEATLELGDEHIRQQPDNPTSNQNRNCNARPDRHSP